MPGTTAASRWTSPCTCNGRRSGWRYAAPCKACTRPSLLERFVAVLQERSEGNFNTWTTSWLTSRPASRASTRYTWRSCRGPGRLLPALLGPHGSAGQGRGLGRLARPLQARARLSGRGGRTGDGAVAGPAEPPPHRRSCRTGLWRWRRFLRREQRDNDENSAIVHQSFADFLATKPDMAAEYKAIACYYLNFTNSWPDMTATPSAT